jgi:DNA-binding PadR family transcriptional regulator
VSPTRLLILGAVRIFQPVHGYLVRREHMSWQVDRWAHLNPGSVYNALRSLARDGYLEEVATGQGAAGAARTTYRLTPDGESELLRLVREAFWTVDAGSPEKLLAGLSFMWVLSREEVAAALEHRIAQIDASHRASELAVESIFEHPHKPDHVAEILRLVDARVHGERVWATEMIERVRGGEYVFAGEDDAKGYAPVASASARSSDMRSGW